MTPQHTNLHPRIEPPPPMNGWASISRRRHVTLKGIVLIAVLGLGGGPASVTAGQPQEPPDPKTADGKERQVEDLAKRLIKGERLPDDVMARIIGQMTHVEQRLLRRFDAGAETQGLQRQIVVDLDAAIRSAIRGRTGGSSDAAAGSDKRQRGPKPSAGPGERDGSGESIPDGDTVPSDAGEEDPARWGPLHESRRGWGHLPARDRDEVIQGAGEQSLEKFRSWIERYYRALAEDKGP